MLCPVTLHKAEKYAVRPECLDEETKTFFLKNWGCARKVYNLLVDTLYNGLEKAGYTGGDTVPDIDFPEVSAFKKDFGYLKEADSLALANARQNFLGAVKRFREEYDHRSYTKRALRRDKSGKEPLTFRGLKGMPKFHAKAMGDYSYTTNCQYPKETNSLKNPTIRLEGDRLYLPKLKAGVRLNIHRPLPENAVIGNVTVSMDTDGAIYVSVCYEYTTMMEMDIRNAVVEGSAGILEKMSFLGLDYSQQDFYVDSEGRKANYPHYYRKAEERLAHMQRQLSHMVKDSNNYKKMQARISSLNVKIRNQRRDFVQKESTYLASRYDAVVVEDIDLRAMGSCLKLGKNLHDNGFGMFRNMLEYKLLAKGSFLIRVDRFFASSQTCSHCGYVNKETKDLKVREWVCPECGTHHDRDHNAAVNIREEGKRIFLEQAYEKMAEEENAAARQQKKKNGRSKKTA